MNKQAMQQGTTRCPIMQISDKLKEKAEYIFVET